MKKLLLSLLLIVSLHAAAQSPLHCGADEMRIATLQKNPAIANAVIRNEKALEQFTQRFVADFYAQRTPTTIYTIPVVFHVIHNYGPENISDAQILDGLDILNKTFRKQLADTASIVSVFKPLHADCEIEFKLATLDPSGNCTSGINRIASPLTYTGDHSVKSLIHWPPSKYLNIYIVSNAAGLAGHCVWPADADSIPAWDGIVIGSDYVGSIGTSNYTKSVALAHECGHYLNLQHIWGGNNVPGFYYYPCADTSKDCSIDDLVADTPPTIGWLSCNLSGHSCGNTVDNVQNAMDYSYCNRMFTYGQKARMQACLNDTMADRNNLWSPANLIQTGVSSGSGLCKADFWSDKTVVCQSTGSNQVNFENTSYHGTFTSISWQFPGGSPSSSTNATQTVTYSTPGKYDVTLKVSTGTDSMTITRSNYISVLPATGGVPPYTESFESISNLDGPDWFSNSLDTATIGWELTNAAAFSGSKCVTVNAHNLHILGKDELISKVVNLNGTSGINISFKYAFAPSDTSTTDDKLQLYIANSCNTGWILRLNLTGSTLETAPYTTGNFVPASSAEWKQATATIPSTWLTSGFRFKFVFNSAGGNNVYVDDINLNVHAGIQEWNNNLQQLAVYPNPGNEQLTIGLTMDQEEKLTFRLMDVLGQEVWKTSQTMAAGESTLPVNAEHIPAGTYVLMISGEHTLQSKRLEIVH